MFCYCTEHNLLLNIRIVSPISDLFCFSFEYNQSLLIVENPQYYINSFYSSNSLS